MISLWHLRGSVALPDQTEGGVVLERIKELLAKQRKPVTDLRADYIRFDDPLWNSMFSGNNWRAMVVHDRGTFSLVRTSAGHEIEYDLRSLHGLVLCLIASGAFFCFGSRNEGFGSGLLFAALAFGWLYGMNMLLVLIRVPLAIRRAVRAQ